MNEKIRTSGVQPGVLLLRFTEAACNICKERLRAAWNLTEWRCKHGCI